MFVHVCITANEIQVFNQYQWRIVYHVETANSGKQSSIDISARCLDLIQCRYTPKSTGGEGFSHFPNKAAVCL